MSPRIKRRDFITLLGGAAAAWPLAARAQQPERIRRVGVLMSTAADDPEGQARIAAFHQGLQQLGWTIGHMCGSTAAGQRVTSDVFADMRRNWLRSRQMSSWPLAAPRRHRCYRRPALDQ